MLKSQAHIPRRCQAASDAVTGFRFAPAKIRATGTVGHQSRFWCQRIELQGADRRVSCHQKQGVLSREAPGKAGEVEAVGAKLPRRCHAASWVPGVVGGGDRPGASIGWNCHQGQGVLARGSVVQAIAFAGIRSGRAAARATAPAPTGKPTASRGQGPHGLLASQC